MFIYLNYMEKFPLTEGVGLFQGWSHVPGVQWMLFKLSEHMYVGGLFVSQKKVLK